MCRQCSRHWRYGNEHKNHPGPPETYLAVDQFLKESSPWWRDLGPVLKKANYLQGARPRSSEMIGLSGVNNGGEEGLPTLKHRCLLACWGCFKGLSEKKGEEWGTKNTQGCLGSHGGELARCSGLNFTLEL